ncbi:MAG TPA: efflux RND transporter periplasmic adaptor subunit [Terriglobales bacterium]|nr:efflux RND transporter periplasmic adaptor subunit [Terriglobales bacterium]
MSHSGGKLVKRNLIFGLVLAAVTADFGCSRGEVAAKAPPVKVEEVSDVNLLTVAHPEQFALVNVATRQMRDQLNVNGAVAPDVNRTVPVNSLASGRVTSLRVQLGDDVKKGQLLLTIHSPDLATAAANLKKTQEDEWLANKGLERAQGLYAKGALAEKDLEAAQDAEHKAKVDVETAQDAVRVLGGDVNNPAPVVALRAPASGTIIEQNVNPAAGVKSLDNSPNLFTIADLSRVWILCDVYENNLAQVQVGDVADVHLAAYPDAALKGRISNISRVLDPNTRTAKVRLELPNPKGILRPGMFATVTFVSRADHERSVVPASAVMRLHDRDWVFVAHGGKQFRRTQVQAGAQASDGWREVAGLSPGQRVVKDALQFASTVENQQSDEQEPVHDQVAR